MSYGIGFTAKEWYGILALAGVGLLSLLVGGISLICWLAIHLRWV